jgi:glyoxylase-like metal-dependent hydrolase (beta-lactamase superfamily II)
MREITSDIIQIKGAWGFGDVWGGNIYLLVDKKLTLVDAGYRGSARYILKAVGRLGYSPDDITNIIITHHHPDHIRGLADLKKITPARVLAHVNDIPYINGQLPQPGPTRPAWLKHILNPLHRVLATCPVNVDDELKDGDELQILEGIRIIHTPGHTPGSIILYMKIQKAVIIGDLLTHGEKLYLPSREFTVDMLQEYHSIQKLARLEFDIACFGHGPPIMNEASLQIRSFLETLRERYPYAVQTA